MNELYDVEVLTPNKIFVVKGKAVRSPVKFTVDENNLKRVKMGIIQQGILNYSIKLHYNESDDIPEEYIQKMKESIGNEVKVEDLENVEKENTILNSLLKD